MMSQYFFKAVKAILFLMFVFLMAFTNAKAQQQDGLKLEEITVTALRSSDNTKNVPVSVSVLDQQELFNIQSSAEDIKALSGHVPGLFVESSNGRVAPRFYLRGLGNVDFDLSASQPVSVIFDDVVAENVILKSFPLFDIEKVEVMRGPQGSMFGRNTTAGIVKFDTVKPTNILDGHVNVSYGSLGSSNTELAIGGPLVDGILSGRFALLSQQRDDWIDNKYTGQNDYFGGHNELAGRVQFLLQPTQNFSALLNVHARDLDGSQTAFRANIFDKGSNKLNKNYSRGSVFYDGGDANTQQYDGSGESIKLNWLADTYEVISLTSHDQAKGSNTGDIDGGVAGVGPGFIPFSSATIDRGDIDQFTQEIRVSSINNQSLAWQLGVFYFKSDLDVFTGAGFNSATVTHKNISSAIFGNLTYRLSPKLSVNAGIRATEDKKRFSSLGLPDIEKSDNEPSGDIALNYLYSEDTTIYGRIARGFRGPSIQGRNVAFFGAPSVANSETLNSFEVGFKSDFNETLRLNGALYHYVIHGFQVSAIGGTTNSNSLLNASRGVGDGYELELEYLPSEQFKMKAGIGGAFTKILDRNLYTATCGSQQCTLTDELDSAGNANLYRNPFPGSPRTTMNLSARYQMPVGLNRSSRLYVETDWIYFGKTNLALYESKEFYTDHQYEGGVRVGYETAQLDLAVFARNLTDESNVTGFVDFNNNTGFVNEPRIIGLECRYHL